MSSGFNLLQPVVQHYAVNSPDGVRRVLDELAAQAPEPSP